MNLKNRQDEISKIDLKLDSIQHDLSSITTSLADQIKWIESDENNIKAQIQELKSELKHSDEYFNNKIIERRKAIEEKYAKKALQESQAKAKGNQLQDTKQSFDKKKFIDGFDDSEVGNKFSDLGSQRNPTSDHERLNQSGSGSSEKRENYAYDNNDSINFGIKNNMNNSKSDLRGREEVNRSQENFNSGGSMRGSKELEGQNITLYGGQKPNDSINMGEKKNTYNSKNDLKGREEVNRSQENFNSGGSMRGSKGLEGENSFHGSEEKDYLSGQTGGFGNNTGYNSGQINKESKGNLNTEGQGSNDKDYLSGQTAGFGDAGYKSGHINKESKGNLNVEGYEKDCLSGQTFGDSGNNIGYNSGQLNKESKGNLHTEGQNTLRGSNSGQTAGFNDAVNKSGEIKK